MNPEKENFIINFIKVRVQHYNPKKYWKYRNIVIDPKNKTNKIIKYLMLYYIKKCDAFNNASFGTNINYGATFKTPPILRHGLNGIVISKYAKFGKNVEIFQQVSITEDGHKPKTSAIIGDNVFIGAGAKIIGNVKIGNNVLIGANAVVVNDIPSNCTVVGIPAKVVRRHK